MYKKFGVMVGAVLALAMMVVGMNSATVVRASGDLEDRAYIVMSRSAGTVVDAASLAGGSVERRFGSALPGAVVWRGSKEAAGRLATNPALLVEPDYEILLDPDSGDETETHGMEGEPYPWNLYRGIRRNPGIPPSNYIPPELEFTGEGVDVFVIDTGIRVPPRGVTHVEFEDRIGDGTNKVWWEYGHEDDFYDCRGHGTHVAGIIAGKSVGVAPEATIHAVKVFPCGPGGTPASIVIDGISWSIDKHQLWGGPSVMNLSLGGPKSSAMNQAIAQANYAGIVVVVAAGNQGIDACERSPASALSALTVGATGAQDYVTSWSNQGPCVDLFAPGAFVPSAWVVKSFGGSTLPEDIYRLASDTSMSSPHVAGFAARLLEQYPQASPAYIKARLLERTTRDRLHWIWPTSSNRLLYTGLIQPPRPQR